MTFRRAARVSWDVEKSGFWICAVIIVGFASLAATAPIEAGLRWLGLSKDASFVLSFVAGLILLSVGWFYLGRTAVRSFRKDFL